MKQKRTWISDDMNKELERIRKDLENKEQRNITMIDTTSRVSKILKKIKV